MKYRIKQCPGYTCPWYFPQRKSKYWPFWINMSNFEVSYSCAEQTINDYKSFDRRIIIHPIE